MNNSANCYENVYYSSRTTNFILDTEHTTYTEHAHYIYRTNNATSNLNNNFRDRKLKNIQWRQDRRKFMQIKISFSVYIKPTLSIYDIIHIRLYTVSNVFNIAVNFR